MIFTHLLISQLLFSVCLSLEVNLRITRNYSYPIMRDFAGYWNVPSYLCKKMGVDFADSLSNFGFEFNADDKFRGETSNILYDPGAFPVFLVLSNGTLVDRNGGLPQKGNVSYHLQVLEEVIEKQTPKNLSGLLVLDFESYRPIFRQNWNSQTIYIQLSRKMELENNPNLTKTQITALAKAHYENATRTFMELTLQKARSLRPLAKIGYYGFPYCYNYWEKDECPAMVLKENDQIMWLFKGSSALFPSLYMSSRLRENEKALFLVGRMNEAWRMAKAAAPKSDYGFLPVLPYLWFRYHDDKSLYMSKSTTLMTLSIISKYGAGGFVLWGASADINSKDKCNKLLDYLNNNLGPAFQEVKKNLKTAKLPDNVYRYSQSRDMSF